MFLDDPKEHQVDLSIDLSIGSNASHSFVEKKVTHY